MSQRVLILDDETSILEMIGQHLSDEGYDCTTTTSPSHALNLVRDARFELLITDLKMPELHGIEVVRQAKALDELMGIIVVTAMLEVTSAIDALRAGADEYILKPFNLSEITLAVERVLDKQRLVVENRRYQQELESRVAAATAELAAANEELRRTKEYLEDLLDSSVDAVITVGPDYKVSYANEGAVHMLGYAPEAMLGHPIREFLPGGIQEVHFIRLRLQESKRLQNYETEVRHQKGHLVPINMSLSQVRDPGGRLISTLAICKDITEQKRLELELKEMSIKDSLTGLYNQRHFYDRLEAEIERARRQNHPLSLLLFDVDQFKAYNDSHGHLDGDKVLQACGEVVMECTREHVDIGFRYGGDEFVVILPEAGSQQAQTIAERIRATFEARKFDHLTLSIGLMSYAKGKSLKSFIRFADAMMYDAKRSGGNRVYVYNPDVDGRDFLEDDAEHIVEKRRE